MKRVFYIFLCLLSVACSKEGTLDSEIQLEDLYAIQDDPTDPVKSRVYGIYTAYGVPVYFNDTIGRVFLKKDIYGNDIYKYEKLDLAWGWHDYEKVEYRFDYVTDQERRLEALSAIETYLKAADPALYPFCFFVSEGVWVKSLDTKKSKRVEEEYLIDFRTLTLVLENRDGEKQDEILAGEIQRDMIKDKITNYPEELAAFNAVSNTDWYGGKYWSDLDQSLEFMWDCDLLNPDRDEKNAGRYNQETGQIEYPTKEEFEAMRAELRIVCGSYGFVMGSVQWRGMSAPYDVKEDLDLYIKVMLATPAETFRKQWGSYPLVMEKYGILYGVISEKLGVEL